MRRPLKACIVTAVRAYQRYLSPFIPANCRYIPTCSEYMLSAIQQHGTRRGLWLGIKRIGRCHPLGGHGYDPVPDMFEQKPADSCRNQSSENPASEVGHLASKQNSSLTGRKSNNG